MLDISKKLLELDGFRKVDYVANKIGLTRNGMARILELENSLISNALDKGAVARDLPEYDEVFERLYNLTCLFSYLLNMADYRRKPLQDRWGNSRFWDSAIIKPPWYEKGLRDYLFEERYKGLESCLEWIKRY